MKLSRVLLHDTIGSVSVLSTISNVFFRNGGGPDSCKPSMGFGRTIEEDEELDDPL
uniref:Heat shock factor protein HSF30-like n=1 Tax=Rhizophora mucronata TaxID=61149 RepID=A0A2P2N4F1_RHIMU